jgi:hypothetical protein
VPTGAPVTPTAIQAKCDLAKPMAVDLVGPGSAPVATASLQNAHYLDDGSWEAIFIVPVVAAGEYGLVLRCSAPPLDGGAPLTITWSATLRVIASPATDAARAIPPAPWLPVAAGLVALAATLLRRPATRPLTRP